MGKRGQATIFIILGIVLVILISLVFVYKDSVFDLVGISQEVVYPSEIEELRDNLYDCFYDTAETSFFELGYQGGYYELPRDSYETGFLNVPYFYVYGDLTLVDIVEFEEEFENGFENALTCVDFEGFNVTEVDLSVEVQIGEVVTYVVDYPFEIVYGGTVYDVDGDYEFTLNVPFQYVYTEVSEFVRSSSEDYIDVSYLLDKDFESVDYFSPEDETYVFFTLKSTDLGNYTYSFAMKYNFSDLPEVYEYYGGGL